MAAPLPTLAVRDLSIDYRSAGARIRAVQGVSFDIGQGEAVGLIGESGSGKTTVGMGVMRLLPPNAEVRGGRIEYGDLDDNVRDVLRLSGRGLLAFRWSGCALVPQGAISALNPVMRIGEHFADTAAAHGYLAGRALEARAGELLTSVRLEAARVWRAYPHELSGGMRQRVLIALALLLSPRLLILDEPTTALDILTQRTILDILLELRRTVGFSLLFISHDLTVAAELCDRLLTMYAGRAIELAPTRALMAGPRHPYTIALLRAIPSLVSGNEGIAAIPGSPPDLAEPVPGCPFVPRCPLAVDICREVDPSFVQIAPQHAVSCHRWQETGAGTDPATATAGVGVPHG